MITILHILGDATIGGISSVILNYYKFIDRNRFSFDIAVSQGKLGRDAKILQSYNSTVYQLPLKSESLSVYTIALEKILREKHYDIIHVHDNATSYVALAIAKKMGVKIRFAHAHTSGSRTISFKKRIRLTFSHLLNGYYATHCVACGEKAGLHIFGHRIMSRTSSFVLPNSVNTDLFSFNKDLRNKIRSSLGIDDKFVVGMVGRISQEKNQVRAIALFHYIKKKIPNAILLIVGDGPEKSIVKDEILKFKLQDSVKLLGSKDDVQNFYQSFDIFMLPSLYEGFPVAAVEAMASGLPVLLSDTITSELSFGTAIHYLSLLKAEDWAITACLYLTDDKRSIRQNEVASHGLDIRHSVTLLENAYINALNNYV